jgi:hypothetical protein
VHHNNKNIIIICLPNEPTDPEKSAAPSPGTYFSRVEALQLRVNEAARALHERGVRPTVARVRAALGGGSPNDLAPALRHWKESVLPTLAPRGGGGTTETLAPLVMPALIADLTHELWHRATAAAVVELKGGRTASHVAARSEEAQSLRNQVSALRDQLQRDALAYGELRAQSARHEAIAREALGRAREAEGRERDLLRELGDAQQRVAELIATIEQLRAQPAAQHSSPHRRPAKKKRSTTQRAKRRAVKTVAKLTRVKRLKSSVKHTSRRPSSRRR